MIRLTSGSYDAKYHFSYNETSTNIMRKLLQTNSSLPQIETGAVNLCCSKGLFDEGLVHGEKSRQRR